MSSSTIPLTSIDSSINDYEIVQSLSLALVREYLAKRKFTTTLNSLYSELGYKPQPTTTAKIADKAEAQGGNWEEHGTTTQISLF